VSVYALFFCQQISVVVLLAVTHASFSHGMNMLMTEQVNQCQIAVDIFAPLGCCQAVVNLNFFIVEEGFSTFQASTLLSLGQFLF
jgi:hypothetical protein